MILQKKMSAILGIFVLTSLLAISGCTAKIPLSVQIDSPEDGAEFSVNVQKVSGVVSDPDATVRVNGVEANVNQDGDFYAYIKFNEGENTIKAEAIRGRDNYFETVIVTFTPATLLYPVPAVSEDQAFAIAKQYVPASVLYAPNIITVLSISQRESHGFWSTFFDGLNIAKQELIDFGWREDATTFFGETEPYSRIEIGIDAQTGEVAFKIAGNGIQLGGRPPEVPSS